MIFPPRLCLAPNAAAQARQTAGARHERTLSAVACSRLLDRALGCLKDSLEPLFERLCHCRFSRREESLISEGGIKVHPSTDEQREGLACARKRRGGGGSLGRGSYLGLGTFHYNIPRPAGCVLENKPIPKRGG